MTRSIEQKVRIVQILTGIVKPTMEQTLDWLEQMDTRNEVSRQLEQEKRESKFVNALAGNTDPVESTPTAFSRKDSISVLQDLILTYQKFGADPTVISAAEYRLEQLQKGKK